MSQANELLNSLSEADVDLYTADPATEGHVVIGADRFITVPEELKRIAVQKDHNIETVTFDCPRYWDDHDLSKMAIYINYRNANNVLGAYLAENVTVDEADSENLMHFTWTISGAVTTHKGSIAFLVCAKSVDKETGEEILHWNSEMNTDMYISEGLETVAATYTGDTDLYTQLLHIVGSAEVLDVMGTGLNSERHNGVPKENASGNNSFVQGRGTIARGTDQHARGRFNVADTANKYADIVGNGTSETDRSNAYTLDWDGNAEFAGRVTANGVDILDELDERVSEVDTAVDNTVMSTKNVPVNTLPNAKLIEMGGNTRKCTNLIPPSYIESSLYQPEDSGITWTVLADGGIHAKGTAVKTAYYNITNDVQWATESVLGVTYPESPVAKTVGGLTFSPYISYDVGNNFLYIAVKEGATVDHTFYPMINYGSTALPYEYPYDGLRSSKITEIECQSANLYEPFYTDPYTVVGITVQYLKDEDCFVFNGTLTAGSATIISPNTFNVSADSEYVLRTTYVSGDISGFVHNVAYVGQHIDNKRTNWFAAIMNTSDNVATRISDQECKGSVWFYFYGTGGVLTNYKVKVCLTKDVDPQTHIPYIKRSYDIPASIQALNGYGEGNPDNTNEYNYVDFTNGIYHHVGDIVEGAWVPLATPEEIDISDLLLDSIKVEPGGTVTFVNEYDFDIPNTVEFYTSDDVKDVIGAKQIVGDLVGNSSSANVAKRLSTPRTITLSGDVEGSTEFDGSNDVTINATVKNLTHTHDTATESNAGFMSAADAKYLAKVKTTDLGNFVNKTLADLQTALANWISARANYPNATAVFSCDTIQDIWNGGDTSATFAAGGQWTVRLETSFGGTNYAQLYISRYFDKHTYIVALSNGTWQRMHKFVYDNDLSAKMSTSGGSFTGGVSTSAYKTTTGLTVDTTPQFRNIVITSDASTVDTSTLAIGDFVFVTESE